MTTGTGSHPAIFAGLLGSAVWGGLPTVALASPIDDVYEAVSGSLLLQFVAGCAIGAAVAGVISFVADRFVRDDDDEEEEEAEAAADTNEEFWRTSSLSLIKAEDEAGEDDPTGDLGRYRTGQITIDFPALGEQAVEAAITGPRHFAPANERRPEKRTASRGGRHFASAVAKATESAEPVAEAPVKRGRHFATSAPKASEVVAPVVELPVKEADAASVKLTEAVVASVATEAVAPKTPELHGRARLAALPVIESRRAPVRAPRVSVMADVSAAEPEAATAEPVAVPEAVQAVEPARAKDTSAHKEHKLGITGRLRMNMAARAKGVRAVLAERLGHDALEGVPIIERADGSVSDVEPTWFDQNVVPALASITGITQRVEDTSPRLEEHKPELIETERPSRASYISHRVAEVNVGIFPERRSADELEKGDVWEEALAAMGETIAQNNPSAPAVFQDVVGGPATIDDPDGLEGPTGFIPFRVPAAHPEVVDTETYVDYLLRDEISQNGSVVLGHSPHAHLRVIEGGTGKLRMRRRAGDTGSMPTGRHFAQPDYAREA